MGMETTVFKSSELSLINCSIVLTLLYHYMIYMHTKKLKIINLNEEKKLGSWEIEPMTAQIFQKQ